MKVKLVYKSQHQAEIFKEIEEDEAKKLVKEERWSYVNESKMRPMNYPTMKWTEMKIRDWLKEHNIPIDYNITNDEKKDKLTEIEEYFND